MNFNRENRYKTNITYLILTYDMYILGYYLKKYALDSNLIYTDVIMPMELKDCYLDIMVEYEDLIIEVWASYSLLVRLSLTIGY